MRLNCEELGGRITPAGVYMHGSELYIDVAETLYSTVVVLAGPTADSVTVAWGMAIPSGAYGMNYGYKTFYGVTGIDYFAGPGVDGFVNMSRFHADVDPLMGGGTYNVLYQAF